MSPSIFKPRVVPRPVSGAGLLKIGSVRIGLVSVGLLCAGMLGQARGDAAPLGIDGPIRAAAAEGSGATQAGATQRGAKEVQAPERLVGRLRVRPGISKRRLVLTDSTGRLHFVYGPLSSELSRLNNHNLMLFGRPSKEGSMLLFRAADYRIVEVAGQRPEMGVVIASEGDALVLKQPTRDLSLTASGPMMKRLRKRVGCKVWLVGVLTERTLKVTKYGWLNCKAKAPVQPPKKEKRR